MIDGKDLELTSNLTMGKLETNAERIRELVENNLQNYTPDLYVGKVDEAKRDKAVLRSASDMLNKKRLELERKWLEPFNTFKDTIKQTTKAIDAAYAQLDAIVKVEENRAKDEKREAIVDIWDNQDFTLFELEKVFNPKWLNKGYKMRDIESDIKKIIADTFNNLAIIEKLPAEDVPLIKSEYLNTLDLTEAMNKAEQLKANRARLAAEAAERQAAEVRAQVESQKKEERKEQALETVADLVAETLSDKPVAERLEFALVLEGEKDDLIAVRRFMTSRNVTYKKLQENNGVYTVIE